MTMAKLYKTPYDLRTMYGVLQQDYSMEYYSRITEWSTTAGLQHGVLQQDYSNQFKCQ